MVKRWPIKEEGDASILNEKIYFPTSQRVAKNRLLKVKDISYQEKKILQQWRRKKWLKFVLNGEGLISRGQNLVFIVSKKF